jgi:hypothetical protein
MMQHRHGHSRTNTATATEALAEAILYQVQSRVNAVVFGTEKVSNACKLFACPKEVAATFAGCHSSNGMSAALAGCCCMCHLLLQGDPLAVPILIDNPEGRFVVVDIPARCRVEQCCEAMQTE